MKDMRGFTLVEMMMVVFIIAILAVMGFPAMNRMMSTQAVRSAAYNLFADLVYARSEAITRGTTVTVEAATGTNNWGSQGWTIRENAGGTVLRSQGGIANLAGSDLTFTGSTSAITFERSGRAQSAGVVTFDITPIDPGYAVQPHMKRCVRLDPSGRPRSAEGACT